MNFKSINKLDEYECGPRPPVPGGESSRSIKMTEGYSSISTNFRNPSHSSSSASSPSYLRWAHTLSYLLEDREGVELFKRYVEQEGAIHRDRLNFYFACEGLKQQTDPDKIKQMIGAIYKFLKKTQMPVSEEVRRVIKAGLKNEVQLKANIYDQMQQDVERIISETTYLHFLKSEIYLEHVRNMTSTNNSGTCSTTPSMSSSSSHSMLVNPNVISGSGIQPVPAASSTSTSSSTATSSTLVTNSTASANAMLVGTVLGSDQLTRSLTLPTLHEDAELVCDNIVSLSVSQFGSSTGGGRTAAEPPMRLTKDSLLATEQRRLEIRPPGAHGYSFYNNYESYNTVSLQDSERQSFSSGQTDSDTASMATSTDGRPYIPRRQTSMENRAMRQNALTNKEADIAAIIPRTHRMHTNKHFAVNPKDLVSALMPKLEAIKKKQDMDEMFTRKMQEMAEKAAMFHTELRDAIQNKLPTMEDDNDQDILDQHVQRVWSDLTPSSRSPGTMSPGMQAALTRRRINEFEMQMGYGAAVAAEPKYPDGASSSSSIISVGVASSCSGLNSQQMRHSRSMPNKWPSTQTDSGISLFSGDTTLIKKESSSRKHMSSSEGLAISTASQLEEARRRLEDETKRSRRYGSSGMAASGTATMASHKPPPQTPPILSTTTHHQQLPSNIAPAQSMKNEYTTVVFTFCDEEFPYRTKIPGLQPTLKQFKEYLPKKGNFRFFFKTVCEDLESPVIQEEVTSDTEMLPLFEGKVMGLVKPAD